MDLNKYRCVGPSIRLNKYLEVGTNEYDHVPSRGRRDIFFLFTLNHSQPYLTCGQRNVMRLINISMVVELDLLSKNMPKVKFMKWVPPKEKAGDHYYWRNTRIQKLILIKSLWPIINHLRWKEDWIIGNDKLWPTSNPFHSHSRISFDPHPSIPLSFTPTTCLWVVYGCFRMKGNFTCVTSRWVTLKFDIPNFNMILNKDDESGDLLNFYPHSK